MFSLAIAIGLGLFIASPQLTVSLRYWPHSRRATQGYLEKVAVGNAGWNALFHGVFLPRTTQWFDGVYYAEYCSYIGYVGLGCACLALPSPWHGIMVMSLLFAMGRHTPLFQWTHKLQLRIPARYCYFLNLSLAILAINGFVYLSTLLTTTQLAILLLLQAWDLSLNVGQLIPTNPYCQRWERPETVFANPLASFLAGTSGRVSGLPYPLRTGQVNRIHTLGYNGGSQARWMSEFRNDPNPLGSGGHDWFSLADDSSKLDWYGVQYAYTYRPLKLPKWRLTTIPHLYRNRFACQTIPQWEEMANALRPHRHPI